MSSEFRKLEYGEIGINLKYIVESCWKRLRRICIAIIVMSVMIAGVLFYLDIKDYRENGNDISKVEWTENDQQNLDVYNMMKCKVDSLSEYNQNAVIMQLDFNNVPQIDMQIYVSANEDIKADMISALMNYINKGLFVNSLIEDKKVSQNMYFQDMVQASPSVLAKSTSNILNIIIYGETQEKCQQYAEWLETAILEYSNKLETTIGENELLIMDRVLSVDYREAVYVFQKDKIDNLNISNKELADYYETLSLSQKSKINPEILGVEMNEPNFGIKHMLFGLLLSAIMVIGGMCVITLFDGKIQSENEVQRRTGWNDFGTIFTNNIEKYVNLVVAKICFIMKNEEEKKIMIISTRKLDEQIMTSMKTFLNRAGLSCETGENILNNQLAIEELSKQYNVIVVESIGTSSVRDVYEEAVFCKNMELKVIGYISIKEN